MLTGTASPCKDMGTHLCMVFSEPDWVVNICRAVVCHGLPEPRQITAASTKDSLSKGVLVVLVEQGKQLVRPEDF